MLVSLGSELQLAVENILDTFSGADGGGDFVKFVALLQALAAKKDDPAAAEVLLVVKRFSRLLDVAKKS